MTSRTWWMANANVCRTSRSPMERCADMRGHESGSGAMEYVCMWMMMDPTNSRIETGCGQLGIDRWGDNRMVVCDIAQRFGSMFILLRAVRGLREIRNATIHGVPRGVRGLRTRTGVRLRAMSVDGGPGFPRGLWIT
jgi:hypothetical protein